MFTKEEFEIIERMCHHALSDIADCMRRAEDFPKHFVGFCKDQEPKVEQLLEKVRKM